MTEREEPLEMLFLVFSGNVMPFLGLCFGIFWGFIGREGKRKICLDNFGIWIIGIIGWLKRGKF